MGANPAHNVFEFCDGENLRWWSQLELFHDIRCLPILKKTVYKQTLGGVL